VRLLLSVCGVAIVTFFAYRVIPANMTTAGFAYLLLVLVVASTWGFLESAVTTVLSTLTFDFFFVPSIGAFGPYKTEDLVAFVQFSGDVADRQSIGSYHQAANITSDHCRTGPASGAGGSRTCQPGDHHGRTDRLPGARSESTDCRGRHRRQYLLALACARHPPLSRRRATPPPEQLKTQRALPKSSTGSACSSRKALLNGSWFM